MEANFVSESRVDMVVQRGPTSRYKGVSLLKSGNWGARISFMHKPYWLGTYQIKEEAAIAYDRASIKLQRGDTSLNFHWTKHSGVETIFQSQYSTEEILTMLRDKTYASKLMSFVSRLSLATGTQTSTFLNEQGISYHLFFQKDLSNRDVTRKCLPIPNMSTRSVKVTFYDIYGRSWTFGYSYWECTQSFMLTNGWGHFIKMNNLNQNDTVMLYRCEYEGEALRGELYMIDFHRNNGENSLLGRNTEGLDGGMELEADEKKKGFKLFGVEITGE